MATISLPKNPPYVLSILSEIVPAKDLKFIPAKSLAFTAKDGNSTANLNSIMKLLSGLVQSNSFIGSYDETSVMDWIDLVYKVDPSSHTPMIELINKIESSLEKSLFLVSDHMTFADLCVITYLEKSRHYSTAIKSDCVFNWIDRCLGLPLLKCRNFPNLKTRKEHSQCSLESGGRFVELPNATTGSVVVRFPPEASGYLHIGHAKAALLNQFYRDKYKGTLILRFDDTNPSKEKEYFENIILEDVKMLGLTPDRYTKTSDYFDLIIEFAEKMIKKGHAYCDNTPVEIMRQLRNQKQPSSYRDSSIEENLDRWRVLKAGEEPHWCLRAKIDYASPNGCLRDPTIFRSSSDSHPTCGKKYNIYPTYDFACPIVDSIEGVTHALRTSEYHDRDDQYKWIITMLGLREPAIFEYSRLNLQHTILSKRKLTKIVESKVVHGWDDPRMPTVRGLLRRGLTLSGLKEFIIAQGFSKSDVNMKSDKLWSFNRRLVEPQAHRLTALYSRDIVEVDITSFTDESTKEVSLIPKCSSSSSKLVYFSNKIYVESSDLMRCRLGDIVTLINWGNAIVKKISQDVVEFKLCLENKDFSSTQKISWISAITGVKGKPVPLMIISYEELLTKSIITPEDDIEKLINPSSEMTRLAIGESHFENVKKGQIIQIVRKGLFICEAEHSLTQNLILIEIPLGTEKKDMDNKKVTKLPDPAKPLSLGNGKPTVCNLLKNSKSKIIEVPKAVKNDDKKKITKLGLSATKEDDFSLWYTQVLTKSEMLDYYPISGCYVIRPLAYFIWEQIKGFFDLEIKKMGVENCYFPMFVPESALIKEKDHIDDFAPEVAWVTRAGNTDLAEPIAIRPTSETIMYPVFADWIQSYRDLPLRLNQWCNVVRWEFKNPTPFIRTREFLWQEGHSVFAEKEQATKEAYQALDIYERVYKELLAIPVIKGVKSEAEKFAGADFTTTVEAYISACGRGIQGATSHYLGQNFSTIFDIGFENPTENDGSRSYAHQISYGISTRTIGAMVMVHSDNKGLVVPPKVSPIQVVIIPVGMNAQTTQDDKDTVFAFCEKVVESLKSLGIRFRLDNRDYVTPGWKFNHWEIKGVPLRVEVGPKDVKNCTVLLVRRDDNAKQSASIFGIGHTVSTMLDTIHQSLYDKAKLDLESNIIMCSNWEQLKNILNSKKMILAPFCGEKSCEESIRALSSSEHEEPDGQGGVKIVASMGAKSLCIPSTQPKTLEKDTKCIRINCKNKAKFYSLFGRSF